MVGIVTISEKDNLKAYLKIIVALAFRSSLLLTFQNLYEYRWKDFLERKSFSLEMFVICSGEHKYFRYLSRKYYHLLFNSWKI